MTAERMMSTLRALAVVLVFIGATVLVAFGVLATVHYSLYIYSEYVTSPSSLVSPIPEGFELVN